MAVRDTDKKAHNKFNREKMTSISIRLHNVSDAELIEIYKSIPDKAKWFRSALRKYKEESK